MACGVPCRVWALCLPLWPAGCPSPPAHPSTAPGSPGLSRGGSDVTPQGRGAQCSPGASPCHSALAFCRLLSHLQSRLSDTVCMYLPPLLSALGRGPATLRSPYRCPTSTSVCGSFQRSFEGFFPAFAQKCRSWWKGTHTTYVALQELRQQHVAGSVLWAGAAWAWVPACYHLLAV